MHCHPVHDQIFFFFFWLDRKFTGVQVFEIYTLCLMKYDMQSSNPNAMFAYHFENFFLTDLLSLAVLFLGMFVCIMLALFNTCHCYKMHYEYCACIDYVENLM